MANKEKEFNPDKLIADALAQVNHLRKTAQSYFDTAVSMEEKEKIEVILNKSKAVASLMKDGTVRITFTGGYANGKKYFDSLKK